MTPIGGTFFELKQIFNKLNIFDEKLKKRYSFSFAIDHKNNTHENKIDGDKDCLCNS